MKYVQYESRNHCIGQQITEAETNRMLQFELLFKNLNQRKSIDIVIKCVMGFINNVMSRVVLTQKYNM